ncbi:MAG: hypothetical protein VKO39_12450 [Cyanobacteriota bacterium]|nr:hypothetical protein [Cyanobacteriota bacterium]
MSAQIVLANGMFRSGSTFFFDTMRQCPDNVCYYEPFHPKMNVLIREEHQASLGHSLTGSPWLEHITSGNLEEYYNYADSLPAYIRERMGYHSPLQMTRSARQYFESLPLLAKRLNKNIFACFNRAAFVLPEARQSFAGLKAVIAYTKRPSIQIAISFLRLYSVQRSFNLFSREFRDPWGVNLLFQHHYTTYSPLFLHASMPPTFFTFLAKVCYVNTVIDRHMKGVSDFVFDISESADAYVQSSRDLLERLGAESGVKSVVAYIQKTYRQDLFPAKIRHAYFDRYDKQLLESVGFAELA